MQIDELIREADKDGDGQIGKDIRRSKVLMVVAAMNLVSRKGSSIRLRTFTVRPDSSSPRLESRIFRM